MVPNPLPPGCRSAAKAERVTVESLAWAAASAWMNTVNCALVGVVSAAVAGGGTWSKPSPKNASRVTVAVLTLSPRVPLKCSVAKRKTVWVATETMVCGMTALLAFPCETTE